MQRTLALLIRALRQEAWDVRPHLTRAAFVVPILLFLFYVSSGKALSSAPGWYFFLPLVYLNFSFIMLAGCSYFATPITEEKEEKTLGLLRMAGVGPLTLLLGRGSSRLFTFSLLLLIQLPFMILAVTLGGVALSQVKAVFAALLAFLFFVSSLGLLCSVYCRTSSRATSLAATLVISFLFLPTVLGWAWSGIIRKQLVDPGSPLVEYVNHALTWSTEISPFYRVLEILRSGFTGSWLSTQVVANTLGSVLLFLIAWLTFDLFNGEEREISPARSWVPRMSVAGKGNPMGTRRVWRNALMWKDFHFFVGGKTMMVAKLIGYSLVAVMMTGWIHYVESLSQLDRTLVARVLIGVGLFAAMLECAITASRIFREECRWRTLSGLTLLPISTARLAYSKLLGCALGLIPAAILFLAGSILAPELVWDSAKYTVTHPSDWGGWLVFIVFLHFVAYLSLRMKRGALPIAFLLMALCWTVLVGIFVVILNQLILNGQGHLEELLVDKILPPVFALTLLSIIVLLHFRIGRRLRQAAGE